MVQGPGHGVESVLALVRRMLPPLIITKLLLVGVYHIICTNTIIIDKINDTNVFIVMASPNNTQVNIVNTIILIPKAINLPGHNTPSNAIYESLVALKNMIDMGTPNNPTKRELSQKDHLNCPFNWNHTITFPIAYSTRHNISDQFTN